MLTQTKPVITNHTWPLFTVSKISSFAAYQQYIAARQQYNLAFTAIEKALLPEARTAFTVKAYCYVCQNEMNFLVDFARPAHANTKNSMPNWREKLICPQCHLNNRMRATIHLFEQECHANKEAMIYLTEQTTPLYRWFHKNYNHVTASEYLGDTIPYGSQNNKGIHNEDMTQLSFADNYFDYILSFDVFEHIFDYKAALQQCLRCLKPNGQLLLSVPFVKTAERTIIRAYIDENGEIQHILKPEYHGDPVNASGCLCFYHFGWELLHDLNDAGFSNSHVLLYRSRDYAYLGGEQIIIQATK